MFCYVKDETSFSPNFQITTQAIAHDAVLEESGNDFMCIKLQSDTLNAVWGDPRNGKLNIWFQRMYIDGTIIDVNEIANNEVLNIFIFPNPTTAHINIEGKKIDRLMLHSLTGEILLSKENEFDEKIISIDLSDFPIGTYLLEIQYGKGSTTKKVVKQ